MLSEDQDLELEQLLAEANLTLPNTTSTQAQPVSQPTTPLDDISNIQNLWKLPQTSIQAAIDVSQVYKTKHGMFAGVPILCKGVSCPYAKVCMIPPNQRVNGGRCPMEAGAVMARFELWCKHFLIDISGPFIKDEDLVDASLIRDLVDNEVQTLRAENRIAINADFIGEVISQIDNKGNVYYEETVTPAAEFKLLLQDKRYKLLNLLNSTRKDKAHILSQELNPSQQAASIFRKVAEMLPDDLDSIDFSNTPATNQVATNGQEVKSNE